MMRQYAADYPEVRAAERLQKIEEDYQLMLDFMYRGFKDDKREQMYLMGHEDISTTIKNYQTISVEHINRKELNRISKKKNGSSVSGKK